MRIVGGTLKGRLLESRLPAGIRPTTDRTRESIFNILSNQIDLEDKICADICAGTGAFGIECISRGAQMCFFYEKNPKTAYFIQTNLEKLGILNDYYDIRIGDAISSMKKLEIAAKKNIFDIAFIDPPYSLGLGNRIAESVAQLSLIKPGGYLIIEHGSDEIIIQPDGFSTISQRSYGDTKVIFTKRIK